MSAFTGWSTLEIQIEAGEDQRRPAVPGFVTERVEDRRRFRREPDFLGDAGLQRGRIVNGPALLPGIDKQTDRLFDDGSRLILDPVPCRLTDPSEMDTDFIVTLRHGGPHLLSLNSSMGRCRASTMLISRGST
jgi:hypothetical protein